MASSSSKYVYISVQEISDLRRETGRLAVGQTKAEKQLTEEVRLRTDVESRNKVLEEEMTKVRVNLFCRGFA